MVYSGAVMLAVLVAVGGVVAAGAPRRPTKLQWPHVVERLADLATHATHADPTKAADSHMWAEQLHAGPDIYAVHNYLDAAEIAELLNLHDGVVDVVTPPRTTPSATVTSATVTWCWSERAHADLVRVQKKIVQAPAKVDESWCLELAPGESPNGGAQEVQQQVSTSSLFIRGDSEIIDRLERKTTALLALPGLAAYHGQIVRYDGAGSGYKVHTDCHRKADRFANNRAVSFLIYLLDRSSSPRGAGLGLGSGGETVFPSIGVEIAPEAGMAILWNNLDADGRCDPRTEHASIPLRSGKKAIFQRWYYERHVLPGLWRDAVNCDGSGSCRRYVNSGATRSANRLYDRAGVHQQRGHTDAAIALYRDAHAAQPLHLQTLVNLAYLLDGLNREDDAIEWFEKLLAVFPIHTGARFRLAELSEDRGNIAACLGHYDAVAADDATNTDPLLRAANAAWNGGMLAATHRYLSKVLALEPGNAEVAEALQTASRQMRSAEL